MSASTGKNYFAEIYASHFQALPPRERIYFIITRVIYVIIPLGVYFNIPYIIRCTYVGITYYIIFYLFDVFEAVIPCTLLYIYYNTRHNIQLPVGIVINIY